jgi:alkylation response protein AidB-like acyl-CoA dehydrogenase
LGVGLQAIGLMERAYQHALGYAKERVQGRNTEGGKARIIEHADVRRMLLEMRALTSASRGIAMMASATIDIASHSEDPVEREAARVRGDLLTPIVKAFPSESALKVTSHAIQVWGGMGCGALLCLAVIKWRENSVLMVLSGAQLLLLLMLNLLPASTYFEQTMQTWEQGRFIRFHGLTPWLSWWWPWLLLAWASWRMMRRSAVSHQA